MFLEGVTRPIWLSIFVVFVCFLRLLLEIGGVILVLIRYTKRGNLCLASVL